MKIFTIAASCLLSASLVSAECVTVIPLFQPSSLKVRITALFDGKPLRDAKLLFYLGTEQQIRLSLSTNQQGVTATPRLDFGLYRIVAIAPGNLHAELYLDVSKTYGKKTKTFVMDFKPLQPIGPAPGVSLADAEKTPITERVRKFDGVVLDPPGSAIPDAEIQVLRKGAQGEVVTKIKSDISGHFSVPLVEGTYIALFQKLGFRIKVVAFELAQDATSKDLRISMQIGGC